MQQKLGVVIIGVNGAVSSTLIAGARLMAAGLAPKLGMLTEPGGNPAPGEQVTDFLQCFRGSEYGKIEIAVVILHQRQQFKD